MPTDGPVHQEGVTCTTCYNSRAFFETRGVRAQTETIDREAFVELCNTLYTKVLPPPRCRRPGISPVGVGGLVPASVQEEEPFVPSGPPPAPQNKVEAQERLMSQVKREGLPGQGMPERYRHDEICGEKAAEV